jgi:hypothetical protein
MQGETLRVLPVLPCLRGGLVGGVNGPKAPRGVTATDRRRNDGSRG